VPRRGPRPSYLTDRTTDGTVTDEPVVPFDPERPNTMITVPDADLPIVTVPASTDLTAT